MNDFFGGFTPQGVVIVHRNGNNRYTIMQDERIIGFADELVLRDCRFHYQSIRQGFECENDTGGIDMVYKTISGEVVDESTVDVGKLTTKLILDKYFMVNGKEVHKCDLLLLNKDGLWINKITP